MTWNIPNRRGFTLIELMIVVAVIGLLAAIAIPNFLQFRMKAKTAEAKSNLGSIRSLEIAYFGEYNAWIAGATAIPRPVSALDGNKARWNPDTSFSIIGFAPENMVFFTYGLEPAGAVFVEGATGFTVSATGDLDHDGQSCVFAVNDKVLEIVKSGNGDF